MDNIYEYLISKAHEIKKCYHESVEENGKLSMESFGYSAQLLLLQSILKDLYDYDLEF